VQYLVLDGGDAARLHPDDRAVRDRRNRSRLAGRVAKGT
jgi:hypothetical protein